MLVPVTLVIITLVILLMKQTRKPPNLPPGPPWLPFVGNVPLLKKLSKALGGQHHALTELARRYKTNVLGLKLGKEFVVTVFSYPVVRDVLVGEEYEGRPDNFFLRLRCMGKKRGITCTDGEMWSTQRNFVNRHLRNLGFGKKPMEEMVKDEVIEILDLLKKDGSSVQVDKFLALFVLNVLWTLTTGERISRDDRHLNILLDLFARRARAFDMTGGTLTQYPWLRHVMPEWSGFNLIQDVNANLKEFFMKTVRQHKATWEEGKNDDLIYRYISEMKANNESSGFFTDDQLVMICLDLFIAGSQTTSGTLDFAFLMMIMYPDIQKKVQQQIDQHFSKDSVIEYSDRHKLPYVEAVLLETMRFRHVLPVGGPRRVLKDTHLDGYFLPKDTTILISFYSLNTSSEYWENPDQFMPERFLDENGSLLPNEKLIPFGLGKRRCLGEVLAKSCIFCFFAEILKRFNVTLPPGSQPPSGKYLSGITLSPEPYRAKFSERFL